MMTLIPYAVVWAVLATVVLALYIWRRAVAKNEDETLHVLDAEAAQISQQVVIAKKLEVIDRWGKTLTVIVVIYALVLAALYIYNVWEASTRVMME